MSAVICFCGPSLPPSAAAELFPEATCLPPAAQGDVYRACRAQRPQAVCLIDGYFEHRPAVSHKELLWALSNGIAVYGAASMGALRAIELAPYGMRGWGQIYGLFATGSVEDDDEVAVVHGAAEQDYALGSEALVNMRLTLDTACQQGVLLREDYRTLIARLKQLFYAERTYERLIQEAQLALDGQAVDTLRAWLARPEHRRDAKALDARSLLAYVREQWLTGRLRAPRPTFELAHTDAWRNIIAEADRSQPRALEQAALDALIEEVQLSGPALFAEVIRVATWRALCLRVHGVPEHHLTELQADAAVDETQAAVQALVLEHVPGALRVLGVHAALAERTARKRALPRATAAPSSPQLAQILDAYFRERLHIDVPRDLAQYASATGFSSTEAFVEALQRDYAHAQR